MSEEAWLNAKAKRNQPNPITLHREKVQNVQKYWDILTMAQNSKFGPHFGRFLQLFWGYTPLGGKWIQNILAKKILSNGPYTIGNQIRWVPQQMMTKRGEWDTLGGHLCPPFGKSRLRPPYGQNWALTLLAFKKNMSKDPFKPTIFVLGGLRKFYIRGATPWS